MKKEAISMVKKTAKIAGVTCVAAGAIAIVTSGAALTAIGTGFRYVKETVEKVLKETHEEPTVAEEAAQQPVAAPEETVEEPVETVVEVVEE